MESASNESKGKKAPSSWDDEGASEFCQWQAFRDGNQMKSFEIDQSWITNQINGIARELSKFLIIIGVTSKSFLRGLRSPLFLSLFLPPVSYGNCPYKRIDRSTNALSSLLLVITTASGELNERVNVSQSLPSCWHHQTSRIRPAVAFFSAIITSVHNNDITILDTTISWDHNQPLLNHWNPLPSIPDHSYLTAMLIPVSSCWSSSTTRKPHQTTQLVSPSLVWLLSRSGVQRSFGFLIIVTTIFLAVKSRRMW